MKISIETMKKVGIYCIQNTINNKRYIGSSINIYHRLHQHRSYLRRNAHLNGHLQNSYNKNGEKIFITSILECCEQLNLAIREQYYIDLFNAEYNIDRKSVV